MMLLPGQLSFLRLTQEHSLTKEMETRETFGCCVTIDKTVEHSYVLAMFCLPKVKM